MVSDALVQVLAVSGVAGFATGLGALPVFVTDRFSHRLYDGAMAAAAGVMFGASVFTLILPGLERGTLLEVGAGLLLGAGFLLAANRLIPHVHLRFGDDSELGDLKQKALLIGGAITIHNFPEGLAIGIAFGSGLESVGVALGVAIGLHNIPDGFSVAVPASKAGLSNWRNLFYTALSGGAPEPVAAVVGFVLVSVVTEIFPLAAGFAAGAMLAVVFREVVPSSHGHGYSDFATLTFILGFLFMTLVDRTDPETTLSLIPFL